MGPLGPTSRTQSDVPSTSIVRPSRAPSRVYSVVTALLDCWMNPPAFSQMRVGDPCIPVTATIASIQPSALLSADTRERATLWQVGTFERVAS
jgi:hypothetical protein